MKKGRYCNATIRMEMTTWNGKVGKALNRMVRTLNKPKGLRTEAHVRRGRWLTISTDIATPEAANEYFNMLHGKGGEE